MDPEEEIVTLATTPAPLWTSALWPRESWREEMRIADANPLACGDQ